MTHSDIKDNEMLNNTWGFYLDVEVLGSDIDSYEHVNNTVYHKWIDDCARLHSTALGIDPELASEFGSGMAVIETNVRFIAPALKGDSIRIFTRIVANDGRFTIQRQFEVRNKLTNKLLANAELKYACIKIKTGKPCRMPVEFLTAYRVSEFKPINNPAA